MKKLPLFFLLLVPFILLCLFAFNYLWNMRSMSLSSQNILHIFPEAIESRSAVSQEELKRIFSQEFEPLGEGAQCFACVSQDGKYVIKLFKARHMRKKKWLRDGPLFSSFVSPEKRAHSQARWLQKFHETCGRYALAFDELRNETGLLHLHFSNRETVKSQLKLKNRGEIDLDQVPFLLQEKGDLVPDRIAYLCKTSGDQSAIDALLDLHKMLVGRAEKGFTDPRQCFSVNFAFAGKNPLQIDVGKIVKKEELLLDSTEEIARVTANLQDWIERHNPELAAPFQESLH
ncbi:MAG: hypothetical protein HYX48_07505 [Chlamydiales bacterium]|nr:hypothetical protein [Chlamydiales bacterium]